MTGGSHGMGGIARLRLDLARHSLHILILYSTLDLVLHTSWGSPCMAFMSLSEANWRCMFQDALLVSNLHVERFLCGACMAHG
jgi:hypothetical protein